MKENTPDKTIFYFCLILETFEETKYGRWLICYLVIVYYFLYIWFSNILYHLSFYKPKTITQDVNLQIVEQK